MGIQDRRIMVCPKTQNPALICVEGKREDFPCIPDSKVQRTCRWWVAVQGVQPQSKDITDFYDCSIPWMVTVGVNQSKEACGTTASVDKMVNTFVKVLPPQVKMKIMSEERNPLASNNKKIKEIT